MKKEKKWCSNKKKKTLFEQNDLKEDGSQIQNSI